MIPVANSNWRPLGLALGLNRQQLAAIERKQNTDHKRKRSMFKQWLGIDSEPSWKKVIGALEEINENEAAGKVRLEYHISSEQSDNCYKQAQLKPQCALFRKLATVIDYF